MNRDLEPRLWVAPTGAGYCFFLTVVALILLAINYNNNVLYALAFFLLASGLNNAWLAWRNLKALRIVGVQNPAAFAGANAEVIVSVANRSAKVCADIYLSINGQHLSMPVSVDKDSTNIIRLHTHASRRGVQMMKRLRLLTSYPFGLFSAFINIDHQLQCLVYPEPENSKSIPLQSWRLQAIQHQDADNFSHFRDYEAGDSASKIHWKGLARNDALMSKVFEGASGGGIIWLNWQEAGGLQQGELTELTLSRLCSWVLAVPSLDCMYGLRLPSLEIPPSKGYAHQQRCLTELARYDVTAAPGKQIEHPIFIKWWYTAIDKSRVLVNKAEQRHGA